VAVAAWAARHPTDPAPPPAEADVPAATAEPTDPTVASRPDVRPEAAQAFEHAPPARWARHSPVAPSGAEQELPVPDRPLAEEPPQPWGTGAGEAVGETREAEGSLAAAHRVAAHEARRAAAGRPAALPDRPAPAEAGIEAVETPPAPRADAPPAEAREVELAARELDEQFPSLVVRQARLAQGGQEQELRVRVRPPELGEVRVTFRVRDGELVGSVLAEREDVRGWLAAEAPTWREELASAGLTVERIDVGLLAHDGAEGQAQPQGDEAPQSWSEVAPGPAAAADRPAHETDDAPMLGVNTARDDGRIDYLA
jgi:hypothetical protein